MYCAPPILHALACVSLGPTVEHGRLAVTPLVGSDDPACDYVTLEEGLVSGSATIREVSIEGDTNCLHVSNRMRKPLLIVDGEELDGSIQNRILNLTVLVGERQNADIPVSCVEAGRSTGQTFRFTSASRMQFASSRAEKVAQVSRSLCSHDARQASQTSIWSAIERKARQLSVRSATRAMSAIYEQHASVLDEYVDVVRNVNCRGAIFTLHGRVAGLELFDSTSAWVRLMPKIVRSYAVEALGEGAHEKRSFELTPDALLDVISEAETASFTTFSDAFDVRIKGSAVTGAALVFGSRVIHLAVFADWLASNAGVVSTPQGTAR